MPGLAAFAEVAVPVAVHGTFTYAIPEELRDEVRLGSRVEVPFGSKRTTGFVVGLGDAPPATGKLKPIHAVLDEDEAALLPEIIELCRWAATYYLAPLGEMLRVSLPANMAARGRRLLVLSETAGRPREQNEDGAALIEELRKRPLRMSEALEAFPRSMIRRLRDAGVIAVRDDLRDAVGVRYDRFALLAGADGAKGPKQRAAVELLQARGGEASVRALESAGIGASTIATLARNGTVRIERRPRRHTLDAFLGGLDAASAGEIRYSAEQQQAIDSVRAGLGTFRPFLLEGVTGSGKTEVYIEVMREVVRRGEQALLLVPEISLTPVFAARLKERFGERIAILHSSLSPSERYDQWWRARRGEVDAAIGPRSALFTPFQRLGVIIVDEEGDGAYKQDETPRYNARDLAVVRARLCGVPVVLGSATPSLESRENAERGKYTLLRMAHRVESRPLPEAEVIDLRKERAEKEDRGFVIFSAPL
ncbi:MAG TPA: primosomal protein N', partial [Thermoanaerobaculia bacterium]|nr:primosomal protein N' [Thermoanaerobaculia bacterium]